MFTKLEIYGILGLIILVLIGGIVGLYKYTESEKAKLVAENATQALSLQVQAKTIAQQREDAAKVAAASVALSSQLADAEADAAEKLRQAEADAKDDDLLIQTSIDNPVEAEKKINDEYNVLTDELVRSSTRIAPPVVRHKK